MSARDTTGSISTGTPGASTDGTPDLSTMRLPQNFAANLGVKRLLVNVPVMRPRKQWFVRVHPGEEWRAPVATIELRDIGETYVVNPAIAADLPEDTGNVVLVTAISRDGAVFLWPLRVPSSSRPDPWAESAIAASKARMVCSLEHIVSANEWSAIPGR
jgi:hypothetical protein